MRRYGPTSWSEPGASVEEDDLIQHCEGHLARYKCPQKVLFVDEIPRAATGKVLRSALRAKPASPDM